VIPYLTVLEAENSNIKVHTTGKGCLAVSSHGGKGEDDKGDREQKRGLNSLLQQIHGYTNNMNPLIRTDPCGSYLSTLALGIEFPAYELWRIHSNHSIY
jgi:hypothetical protein